MHPDLEVGEHRLKSKHQSIWWSIHDLGLRYVFKNLGYINASLVHEFYARWDPEDEEQLVPIRGTLIDIFSYALCAHLGASDVWHDPLGNFIARPTYQEILHTLCGVTSIVSWVRDNNTHLHIKFPKKKLKFMVKVWLQLINAWLLPCERDNHIRRERVYLWYLLMIRQK